MKSLKVLLILVIVYILLNYNEVKEQLPDLLNKMPFIDTKITEPSSGKNNLGNNSNKNRKMLLKQNTKLDNKSLQEKELQKFLQLEIDTHLSHSNQRNASILA